MNLFLFILMILGLVIVNSMGAGIKDTAKELENEHDMFKQQELTKKILRQTAMAFLSIPVSIFYKPFVIMTTLSWLLNLQYDYWLIMGLYVVYSYTLKSKRS